MSKYNIILEEVTQLRNTLDRALLKIEHIEDICSDKVETVGNLRVIERTKKQVSCKRCNAQGLWVKTNEGWRISVGKDIHQCPGGK